jgi:uncharacterized membrane protein YjfL (UPF0719 family)
MWSLLSHHLKLNFVTMSEIINTYLAGGVVYMNFITVLLAVNVGIASYAIYRRVSRKALDPNWVESIKHIGGFAAALGTFGTLVGLFFAFNALERSAEAIPFQIIMGGLKVSLITVLYGLIVFFISMIVYIVLKLRQPVVVADNKI